MYLCFLFCIILFIPSYLHGNSISTPSADSHIKPTNVTLKSPKEDLNNSTKQTLITEGGSIESEPIVTLPKELHSEMTNLDSETGKTKSVVPRKGVQYIPLDDNITDLGKFTKVPPAITALEHKTIEPKFTTKANEIPQTKSSTKLDETANTSNNTMGNITNPQKNGPKRIPKKPLVLSVEAISETDKKAALEKGVSSKPMIHDQLPSPNVKYEQMSSSSHPGMVMPVVITILVVPMFAVLGYMALRRGQEAWKNRHYKRMDFLLDGMYND